MITVKLQGGLGNQMFQFAMGFAQAQRLAKTQLQLDTSLLHGRRKYQLDQWHMIQQPDQNGNGFAIVEGTTPTINESGMLYNQGIVDQIQNGSVLNGYWQTEKYFLSVRRKLTEIFYPLPQRGRSNKWQSQIKQIDVENNSVMVHVRRGDYLIEPYHSFHGILPISYYKSAMDHIRRNVQTPRFFVFSDDPAWVRATFTDGDVTIMEPGREANDIYLMSRCRHSIIANSSFSWWGAWLGEGKENGIHIAPKQWFASSKEDVRDIIPERWKAVDVIHPSIEIVPESKIKVLIAVNSWDEDAKKGCHQAIRETWGKHAAPADLRFFVPKVSDHVLLLDEVFVDVSRDYDYVCREVLEILRWSLQAGYDFTFLVSNDVFVLPQKLLKCGFENYDYVGFFHEPDVPLGCVAPYDYKCTFNTADGYGIERKLYNWADGGDGRMLSRKAASAIVENPEAAAYWFAADDIFIGQVLGPLIQKDEIKAWNISFHKDMVPDNGITWHYKNFVEHKDVLYDSKAGWLHKMYGELK